MNKRSILSQEIFDNKNLLIKGESIWHKLWYSKYMRLIGNLYDNEDAIKTWNMLSVEYHIGSESLLNVFNSLLLLTHMKIWHLKIRITNLTDISVLNFFTKKLISSCFVYPTSQAHSLGKLNLQDVNWQTVYILPRLCTIDSHTGIFQYKILNNILYLNNRLFKMNIVNSELCSFCQTEAETIIHLLCSCRKVKQLWTSVQQWCRKCFSLADLSPPTAVLGFLENARAHIH